MAKGKTSDNRKKKYAAHFDITKKNKEEHIAKMKLLNKFWPGKKEKK